MKKADHDMENKKKDILNLSNNSPSLCLSFDTYHSKILLVMTIISAIL